MKDEVSFTNHTTLLLATIVNVTLAFHVFYVDHEDTTMALAH